MGLPLYSPSGAVLGLVDPDEGAMIAAPVASIDDVRNELIDLGYERDKNVQEAAEIAKKARSLLVKAEAAGMTKTEFARLLGVDRTSIYKTYKDPQ